MKIDCHVHSKASLDSYQNFETILDRLDDRGLQGVVIVDHNDMTGGASLSELVEKRYPDSSKRPRIFRGAEYSTEYGHLIVLGLRTPLEDLLNSEGRKFKHREIIESARMQNAFIIWAHPFRIKSKPPSDQLLKEVDAIEVFNARTSFVRGNYQANSLAVEAAKRLNLPIVAGSDGHLPYEIGNAYIEVDCPLEAFDFSKLSQMTYRAIGTPTHPMYECISQMYKGFVQRKPISILKYTLKLIYALGWGFDKKARSLEGHIMTYKGDYTQV